MSKYKVLWIDDKWEEMNSFKEYCELPENGFQMVCCTNAFDGMEIFEKDLDEWAGVILDAKVLMKSTSQVDRVKGMQYSINRINQLKSRREVPYYIFTGQPDLTSSAVFSEQYEGIYFEKDKDEERLIVAIKNNAETLQEIQIIHKHQVVFDTWPESRHELLRILTAHENEEWQNNSLLNDIRKVMDDVMIRLYERGFCTVKHNGTNLNECSKMIGQRYMAEIIPVYIQRSIHLCVNISNDGSHRSKTDNDIINNRAPYLIQSAIYSMLNVLYWCRVLPSPEFRDNTLMAINIAQKKWLKT